MQFIKQRKSISIRNIEGMGVSDNKEKRHGDLLPNTIRCIICGPSNCGKTNVLIGLLESPNGLRFQNVYIFSKTLDQPKYTYLKNVIKTIPGMGFYTFSSNDEVIPPSKAKPNSIMIFDDVMCDKQDNIKSYFCMGRHRGVDCFYLAQSYTRIPKHLIRDNANLLVLFKQDELNLKHIFNDYGVGCDMKFEQFRNLCNKCWSEKYGFVVIDVESDVSSGRYRKGFDQFIVQQQRKK